MRVFPFTVVLPFYSVLLLDLTSCYNICSLFAARLLMRTREFAKDANMLCYLPSLRPQGSLRLQRSLCLRGGASPLGASLPWVTVHLDRSFHRLLFILKAIFHYLLRDGQLLRWRQRSSEIVDKVCARDFGAAAFCIEPSSERVSNFSIGERTYD